MNITSIYNTGVAGLQRAQRNAAQNAEKIARADSSTMEFSKPLVELLADRQQAQAAARLIRTADEMLGTILDIRV